MRYKIAIVILIVTVIAAFVLYKTSPKTKKTIPKRPVPLVQTTEVHPGREKVYVEAFGTVVPAQRITLQSEVEGRIIGQNSELIPGGLINKGEVVIQVDPAESIVCIYCSCWWFRGRIHHDSSPVRFSWSNRLE